MDEPNNQNNVLEQEPKQVEDSTARQLPQNSGEILHQDFTEKQIIKKTSDISNIQTQSVNNPQLTPTLSPVGTNSDSKNGINGPLPTELKHWNWGAFFLTWIWAIGNKTWIGLLVLISFETLISYFWAGVLSPSFVSLSNALSPYFGGVAFIVSIILGIKGNEWAWKNRKFESVEQFKKVQHTWAVWGVVLFAIAIVLVVASFIVLVSIFSAFRSG